MHSVMWLLVIALLLTSPSLVKCVKRPPNSVTMKIKNKSGYPVELFWINVFVPDRTLVKQTSKPVRHGGETVINSYHTHEFLVKIYNPSSTELENARAHFAKGPDDEDIIVTFDANAEGLLKTEQRTKLDDIQDKMASNTDACTNLYMISQNMTTLTDCLSNVIAEDVNKLSKNSEKLRLSRDALSSRLRNYTCADDNMTTSEPISSYVYTSSDNLQIKIDNLYETDAAKIWIANDFVTDAECDVLMEYGRPRLARATVAAEDGTSVVSESRKANQASYLLNQQNPKGDPLYQLYNRVFGLVNDHAGYSLTSEGQEDFTIIQYNVEDQYTPHCDGTCDGSEHNKYGRVATAVIYCKAADRGGGTTFTNNDIFVTPKKGMATFFSYKDMNTGMMDDGDTEHSGCPVLAGEKWITTVWMREGVSNSEPWNKYDPSGLAIMESEQIPLDLEIKTDGATTSDELEDDAISDYTF
jgi:hypothetical protein